MFDIAFLSSEAELQDEGWYGLWGEVILGAHRESFLASLSLWSRSDYEQQWLDAAERIVTGTERSAFVTSAFQFWWAMWRDGAEVRVHEELLTAERPEPLGDSPDITRVPYELIRPYERITEEGEKLSEWRVATSDIEAFLARRAGH